MRTHLPPPGAGSTPRTWAWTPRGALPALALAALATLLQPWRPAAAATPAAAPLPVATRAPSARVTLTFGAPTAAPYRLEVARTPAAHARGLMYRRTLAPRGGMLFVFAAAEPRSFWMKNTYVALDLVFVDADCTVVGVRRNAVPGDERGLGVATPAQYVVELAAGEVDAQAVHVGQSVFFTLPGHACPRAAAGPRPGPRRAP